MSSRTFHRLRLTIDANRTEGINDIKRSPFQSYLFPPKLIVRKNRRRESDVKSFDWFKKYSDIADLLRELIPDKTSKFLMLGCGNSTLSEDVNHSCIHL